MPGAESFLYRANYTRAFRKGRVKVCILHQMLVCGKILLTSTLYEKYPTFKPVCTSAYMLIEGQYLIPVDILPLSLPPPIFLSLARSRYADSNTIFVGR